MLMHKRFQAHLQHANAVALCLQRWQAPHTDLGQGPGRFRKYVSKRIRPMNWPAHWTQGSKQNLRPRGRPMSPEQPVSTEVYQECIASNLPASHEHANMTCLVRTGMDLFMQAQSGRKP